MIDAQKYLVYIFLVLTALLFLLGAFRFVLSFWCRDRSDDGFAIIHEETTYLTNVERWYVWVRYRIADISFGFIFWGLIYFITVSKIDFLHYLIAFLMIPKAFMQSVQGTQMLLRKDKIDAYFDMTLKNSYEEKKKKREAERRQWKQETEKKWREMDKETEENLSDIDRKIMENMTDEEKKTYIRGTTIMNAHAKLNRKKE